ncbi:MAG: hypothetical protein M3R08_09785, partial [Bacteroidota bacterium]|nr:hypothetical protein [Bacteroidota bacterium]
SVGQVALNGTPINSTLFQNYAGCSTHKHAKVSVPPGIHNVTGANGFQLYMFGLGSGESYAASVNNIQAEPIVQDSLICGASTITLNAPGPWINTQWTADSAPSTVIGTGTSLTITPTASESYTVTGMLTNNGCPLTFTYNVGMPLSVPTTATANGSVSVSICQNEQVQLGLDPAPDPDWFDIQWTPAGSLDDATKVDPIASPTSTTWYTVEITSPTGCGSAIDSVLVTVLPGQVLDLQVSANPAVVCQGSTTALSSQTLRTIASDQFNGAASTVWTAIQGGTVSSACGSISGTALYFNGNGQRYAQTIGLNTTGGGQLRFNLKIANDLAPCDDAEPGDNVVLEYSTSNGFSWNVIATYNENIYPGFTPINIAIPAPALSNTTMFRLRQVANSGAGQDYWVIDNFLVARYDNNWLGYQWSPSNNVTSPTTSSTSAAPTSSGWYVLHGTDPSAGCVYRDSVYVTVNASPALQVTPSTTLCATAGIQLSATPVTPLPAAYSWTPSATLNNPNISGPIATPQTTTTYTVNTTYQNGCTRSGQVTITIGQLLNLTITPPADTICQGQQVQLIAAASGASGLTYTWTNDSSLSSPSISNPIATPINSTTYTCTVTDPVSGCSLSRSVTIHVTTGYTANAGADLTLCSALGHQLSVQHSVPNATYSWSPAGNLNASNIQSPTILNDVSATYSVTVTDVNGCSISDQIVITRAYENVPANLSVTACSNTPPTLTAPTAGDTYSWSTGASTPSIVASQSGNYTITVNNAQGCQAITTYTVALMAIPVVDLGPDMDLCGASGQSIDAGNTGSSFLWSTNSNAQTITV